MAMPQLMQSPGGPGGAGGAGGAPGAGMPMRTLQLAGQMGIPPQLFIASMGIEKLFERERKLNDLQRDTQAAAQGIPSSSTMRQGAQGPVDQSILSVLQGGGGPQAIQALLSRMGGAAGVPPQAAGGPQGPPPGSPQAGAQAPPPGGLPAAPSPGGPGGAIPPELLRMILSQMQTAGGLTGPQAPVGA